MESSHDTRVKKLEQDMYFGDARKPGITTRAENLENRMDAGEKMQATLNSKLNAILVLAITILGGMVGELLKK